MCRHREQQRHRHREGGGPGGVAAPRSQRGGEGKGRRGAPCTVPLCPAAFTSSSVFLFFITIFFFLGKKKIPKSPETAPKRFRFERERRLPCDNFSFCRRNSQGAEPRTPSAPCSPGRAPAGRRGLLTPGKWSPLNTGAGRISA